MMDSSLLTKLRFPLIFGTFLIGGYIWQRNFFALNRDHIREERDRLDVSRSVDAEDQKKNLENLKR